MSKASPSAHAAAATLFNVDRKEMQRQQIPTDPLGRPNMLWPNPAGTMRALGSLCAISPHLQQENSPYSICAGQISEAAQFIKANYRYKALEVISTRRSQLYTVGPLAEPGVLPSSRSVEQRPHSLPSQETGWSDCDTGQCRTVARCGSGPFITVAISLMFLPKVTETCCRSAPSSPSNELLTVANSEPDSEGDKKSPAAAVGRQ